MDYQATLYDPIYLIQGCECVLTLPDSGGVFTDLTCLDKTAGVETGEGGGNPNVPTIKPAASFRIAELTSAGITVAQLPKSTLELNGFIWNVINYRLRPSPRGESDGEALLLLAGKVPLDSESE